MTRIEPATIKYVSNCLFTSQISNYRMLIPLVNRLRHKNIHCHPTIKKIRSIRIGPKKQGSRMIEQDLSFFRSQRKKEKIRKNPESEQ